MKVLSADPGLTGALAVYDAAEPDRIAVWDWPVCDNATNAHALADIVVAAGSVAAVVVERVHSMPRQGVASTFKFGQAYGTILGVLAALERPIVGVTPNQWTRHHRLGADKETHRRRCIDRFPADAALFARAKDDGRADAALMALWYAETHFAGRLVVA
ncbi:MAG: hypothetical protein LC750_07595 [Actinobacteria bacterium]|nr:hypothetical protein [Actinomycetota bacterium]